MHKYGDRGQSCLIPGLCLLYSDSPSRSFILNRGFTQHDFKTLMFLAEHSIWSRPLSFLSWSTLSTAFSQSGNTRNRLSHVIPTKSCNRLVTDKGWVVLFFFLKPDCVSQILSSILLASLSCRMLA